MTGLQHPLVQDYLARLDHAGAGLPPEIRAELVGDLSAHLDSALASDATDADVRNALQELGAPEDVAAAAYDGLGAGGVAPPLQPPVPPAASGPVAPVPAAALPWQTPPPPSPWGPVEIIAVIGLTAGTFVVPFVGPLVGIVMAWISDRWSRREKIIATVLCFLPALVLTIGLLGVLAVSSSSSSSTGGSSPAPVVTGEPVTPSSSGGTP